VVIHFTAPVIRETVDTHVFQVLVHEDAFEGENGNPFTVCRCALRGKVLAVKCDIPANPNSTPITDATELPAAETTTEAAAFIIDPKALSQLVRGNAELWIVLRGDFVIDKEKRAIDAEFVRAQLPTGDRADGSEYGVQGGMFESWFTLKQG